MGAWEAGSFQNDTACDWASELAEVEDLSLVRTTLQTVVDSGDEYLEAPEAEEAIAAAEVVARLKGQWGLKDAYSETVDQWVERNPTLPDADLVQLAVSALDRINSEPSELLELWSESDRESWQQSVADLRSRVTSGPVAPTGGAPTGGAGEQPKKKWWKIW